MLYKRGTPTNALTKGRYASGVSYLKEGQTSDIYLCLRYTITLCRTKNFFTSLISIIN